MNHSLYSKNKFNRKSLEKIFPFLWSPYNTILGSWRNSLLFSTPAKISILCLFSWNFPFTTKQIWFELTKKISKAYFSHIIQIKIHYYTLIFHTRTFLLQNVTSKLLQPKQLCLRQSQQPSFHSELPSINGSNSSFTNFTPKITFSLLSYLHLYYNQTFLTEDLLTRYQK